MFKLIGDKSYVARSLDHRIPDDQSDYIVSVYALNRFWMVKVERPGTEAAIAFAAA